MSKPSIGRIVLVPVDALNIYANGADVVPAVITRVWSDETVNLAVFLDGVDGSVARTSAKLYADAEAATATAKSDDRPYAELRCYWPPRV